MNKKILAGITLAGVGIIGATFINEPEIADGSVQYEKTENTLKVQRVKVEETSYNLDELYKQRDRIQARKDKDNARHDAELLEVNTLIDKAEELGVKTAVELEAAINP